ncbi:hypothetical protein Sru01_69900 [Sphaerisporangium rufum]|uniref:P/Homo B domain-containing protein n=2 Tax=Sphaerisporangium rufum TaxID=1381558 RepID=A0A919RA07_9ACTN|nr:hypothetical protein Sru01_69900 [Sphaerisporangium rufum]
MSLSPASGSVTAGGTATATLATQTTSGTAQSIALTAAGLPAGATATLNPTTVTSGGSATLTITTSSTTPNGTYTVTVTGTAASGTHTAAYTLTVGTTTTRTFTNGTDYPIRDLTTLTSPITSTATGTAVSPVKVTVTAAHTCAEDLRIRLQGPNGTWYTLDTSGGLFCTSYGTRTYNASVTQQAAGTWTLEITDQYSLDTGTLDSWSITL